MLQGVFRWAGARGLIYDFLLLSCGIRLLMFQPCFDRILICLIRSLIYYKTILCKPEERTVNVRIMTVINLHFIKAAKNFLTSDVNKLYNTLCMHIIFKVA